jgi:phosphoribosylformylglycinamidine synthase
MWQFAKAVEGMGAACRALDIPITGGNVSLYNETDGAAVLPTPTIGMVGLIEDADLVVTRAFKAPGDVVVLLGEGAGELGGSEYLKVVHSLIRGVPPALDLDRERRLQRLLVDAAAAGLMASAHDCAEGGLAIALAECSFDTGLGVEANVAAVEAAAGAMTSVATLFGESASRVIVSVTPARAHELLDRSSAAGVPATAIGRVGGDHIRIAIDGRVAVEEPLGVCEQIWSTAIETLLQRRGGGAGL